MNAEPPVSGRRFPGEWEPHAATWVFWPTGADRYPYGARSDYGEVLRAFRRLIDVLAAFEPVEVAADPSVAEEARSWLGRRARVHSVPLDDAWARDAGPTVTRDGEGLLALCWRFTGWGGRFGPTGKDARAAARVAGAAGLSVEEPGVAVEGGAILSDGRGTVFSTAAVLEDPGRHGETAGEAVRSRLEAALGASRILGLPSGFAGDDTGGHVDVVASVAPDGAVLLNDCRDADDPNREGSAANRAFLREAGRETVDVPQPEARFAGDRRLPYSYLNFYPCNGAVLLPAFGDRRDDHARGIVAERFPDREVVPLEARPFYLGGGGIHCVTQPVPAFSLALPRGRRQASRVSGAP